MLEEAEFSARRDAEQMAKTLVDFRGALQKVQSINEESWARDNLTIELSRASTAVENARMEWNSARLKFPILDGAMQPEAEAAAADPASAPAPFSQPRTYAEMCRLGLALTWRWQALGLFAAQHTFERRNRFTFPLLRNIVDRPNPARSIWK